MVVGFDRFARTPGRVREQLATMDLWSRPCGGEVEGGVFRPTVGQEMALADATPPRQVGEMGYAVLLESA